MKKIILIIMTILLLLLGAILYGYQYWFVHNHVAIGEEYLPCDTPRLTVTDPQLLNLDSLTRFTALQELDVRSINLSIAQYEQLREALPGCNILWNVPFQDSYFPPDIQELTIATLSESDFESLPYFPMLQRVIANGCKDYAVLQTLQNNYPALDVQFTLPLNHVIYSNKEAEIISRLELHDADLSELSKVLPYFPQLNEVVFTGIMPDNEHIYELMCQYPDIFFQWELTLFGITTPNTATTLILSGTPMNNTTELESYLKYFPNLERVEVCDCGLPSDQMDALSQRYPNIRFVWTIRVGNGTLRTDVTGFIPYKFGYHLYRPLYDKDCTELKYCVDMVCLDLGHMDIYDLSFLANMPKLKYLIVADIPCQDFSPIASLKELIYLEIFVTSFTQHDILLGLTKLEDLNLGTTPANDITVLKQMHWLKRLWIPGTKLNYLQVAELREALPNTQIMVYADHSTDKGWRHHQNYRDMRDLLGMFYMD